MTAATLATRDLTPGIATEIRAGTLRELLERRGVLTRTKLVGEEAFT